MNFWGRVKEPPGISKEIGTCMSNLGTGRIYLICGNAINNNNI